LGIAYAVIGLGLSVFAVRDTSEHVWLEASKNPKAAPASLREVFTRTSFGDPNLFAACQAGLVNNLNDGMSWAIFPMFFASFGLGVEGIGVLKAVYRFWRDSGYAIGALIAGVIGDLFGRFDPLATR